MTVHPGAAEGASEHVNGVLRDHGHNPLHRCGEGADLLVVDDDEQVRTALGRLLVSHGYVCSFADSLQQARELLSRYTYALALIDVTMPAESGVDLLVETLQSRQGTATVMITDASDPETVRRVMDAGVHGYLLKPFGSEQVIICVANALRLRCLEIRNRRYQDELADQVEQRTLQLKLALSGLGESEVALRDAEAVTIRVLARAIEHRIEESTGHVERVSRYSELLATGIGVGAERCEQIRVASPLHDVGKVAIPDGILFKPGRLHRSEMDVVRTHSERGAQILGRPDSELLQVAASIAQNHHERWDGIGYPQGLRGEQIPVEGRIVHVADSFDTMVNRRAYKPSLPVELAVEELRSGRGTRFDPVLVDVFVGALEKVEDIRMAVPDP